MITEYDMLDYLNETADIIADRYGMNVPYCESMDMTLFPVIVYTILDELDDEEGALDDLQFLAENGRIFPEELSNATLDEFKAYCKEHKEEILAEIESECEYYR